MEKFQTTKSDYRALERMDVESLPFPLVRTDFRVFIAEEVFDKINEQAEDDKEVGGILVGDIYSDDSGPYLLIDTNIPALYAEEQGAELTFTHETWNYINQEMDGTYSGKKIIGWYHTHPGFGIFLSERDQFIHRSFFDSSHQIAFVYDPKSRDHGVFVWKDGQLWRLRRYWVGINEHVWDGPRATPDYKRVRKTNKMRPHSSPPQEGAKNESRIVERRNAVELPLLLIGALLLIGGIFVGVQFNRSLQNVELRAQGATEAVSSLNSDLLGILKGSLSDESLGRELDKWHNELKISTDNISDQARTNPELNATRNQLREVLDLMDAAKKERRLAYAMLDNLEAKALASPTDLKQMKQEIIVLQGSLGSFYASQAIAFAQNGNRKQAVDLLRRAISVDPTNTDAYEVAIKQLSEPAEKN